MAYLDRDHRIDEYARLRAENDAELRHQKVEESFRDQNRRSEARRRQLAADSNYFEKHFHSLTDERPAPTHWSMRESPEETHQRHFEYANYYYFTNT
jgi:hypothetical protein